jgi:hypothetical protein
MPIEQYSDDELRQELEQREKAQQNAAIPKPVECPDFEGLKEQCAQYITEIIRTGWADDDIEHYIFEAALSAVYGNSVWEWVNSRIR